MSNPPFKVDLDKARGVLKGVPARHLQTDWLAVDGAGHYAVFLGDDDSEPPLDADAEGTSGLLDSMRASFNGVTGASIMVTAYRNPAHRAREPIFDRPRTSSGGQHHENRFSGYPHLVVATRDGAPAVRQALVDLGGREALTRGPFGVVIDHLGDMTYEELHEARACDGCRVLDDPLDLRARSPEMLAAVGLYVYGAVSGGSWTRITSPAVVANINDIAALGGSRVHAVHVDGHFEDFFFLNQSLVIE